MGFYAGCVGDFTLKNTSDLDKVKKMLADSKLFGFIQKHPEEGTIDVRVYNGSRYYDDRLFELFGEITPYLKSAELCWEGEGSFWKQTYKEDDGWKEIQGEITYDEKNANSLNIEPPENSLDDMTME